MKDKKTGRRFGLVDAVIVLLVLFAVVGLWQRKNLESLFTAEEVLDRYTVTFEVKKVRSTTGELLKKDTAFYATEDGELVSLGALEQDVVTSPASETLRDANGDNITVVYPEDNNEYLRDVSGVLVCEGVERDGAFLVGGKMYLAYDKTISVQTETADLEIVIKNIEKIGE